MTTSIRCVAVCVALIAGFCAATAQAAGRVALVIGNSDYAHVSSLPNPANDAADIAGALERIGFDVTRGTDLDYRAMRLALRDFARKATGAEMVVVYFAGHGIELDNTNYLIPVNAELKSDQDVEFEAVRLDAIVNAVANVKGLKIILVDACRNNPFLADMTQTSATRSIGRGLGRIDPGGVLVGYAARSGTLALDGDGRNSPYAEALLSHIEEPGLELGKMFRRVRDTVQDLTNGYQEPFTYGSLPGDDIFLVPAAAPAPSAPSAATAWEDFRSSQSPEALEAFAAAYPETPYAALAREAAERLRKGPAVPDAEQSPAQVALPDLPGWCARATGSTQELICRDPGLLAREAEMKGLLDRELEGLRGSERGSALVAQREWRISRDRCEADPECINRSYDMRIMALDAFGGEAPSKALIVRAVQEQLNRLSCGAGEPDGVAGGQTRAAFDRLSRAVPDQAPAAEPDSMDTLEALRGIDTGVCSVLFLGVDQPELLNGTWSLDAECPAGSDEYVAFPGETIRHTLQMRSDGGTTYSGQVVRTGNGRTGVVGAQLSRGGLVVSVVWKNGVRYWFSLKPGPAPDVLMGQDKGNCTLTVALR